MIDPQKYPFLFYETTKVCFQPDGDGWKQIAFWDTPYHWDPILLYLLRKAKPYLTLRYSN
jgi:hypothetical protein